MTKLTLYNTFACQTTSTAVVIAVSYYSAVYVTHPELSEMSPLHWVEDQGRSQNFCKGEAEVK